MGSFISPLEEKRALQALRFYRYLSWGLTSGLYLTKAPKGNYLFAAGVVVSLFLAGHLISNFFINDSQYKNFAPSLVFIETVGIALLLIPTGGLDSPFLWYALNPILMAALTLSAPYGWLVLASFLAVATLGSVFLFNRAILSIWQGRSWLLLVFILTTAAAQVFAYLLTGLRKAYRQLGALHQEAEQLILVEEQNRIANEIHDGVAQHLFSIVCALHSLKKQRGRLQDLEVQEQLQRLSQAATSAAQELRASIYRIKPGAGKAQAFTTILRAYLDDLARLNNIAIDFSARGSEDALSPALRQALTRIVKEATANAIRHGRCRHIDIELEMQPGNVALAVCDDGIGFDTSINHPGLGLANMAGLLKQFGGDLKIDSSPGSGTQLLGRIGAL